jgi:SAM-dependent methyltransferase
MAVNESEAHNGPDFDGTVKRDLRGSYDAISEAVTGRNAAGWTYWLHAGVAAAEDRSDPISSGRRRWGSLHADFARLPAELFGPDDLDGAVVMEVGCGRGGNLLAASRWFEPRILIGLDLSGVAAKWVGAALGARGVRGIQGDAEHLPVRPRALDALICIESAAHYPDRVRFYAEVADHLRAGGRFYYAEGMPHHHLDPVLEALALAGLGPVRTADVSSRVAAHWRRTVETRSRGDRRARSMEADEQAQVGGVETSALGQFLLSEDMGYYLMVLERSDRPNRADEVPEVTRELLAGDGDFARGIMEAFSRGSWLDGGSG